MNTDPGSNPNAKKIISAAPVIIIVAAVAFGLLRSRLELAPSDMFFIDSSEGEGWLQRCQDHAKAGRIEAAIPACVRAQQDARTGSATYAKAHAQLATLECSGRNIPRIADGSLGYAQLYGFRKHPVVLQQQPDFAAGRTLSLSVGFCVELGRPIITPSKQVWFGASLPSHLSEGEAVWYLPASLVERPDAPELLAKCRDARASGQQDNALEWCRDALWTSRLDVFAPAAAALGEALADQGKFAEAIEWQLTAASSHSVGSVERTALTRSAASFCERAKLFARPPGDPRTFRVVNWRGDERGLDFFKEPPESKDWPGHPYLRRGTCVLATGKKTDNGQWAEVDVAQNDLPFRRGWLPDSLLEP